MVVSSRKLVSVASRTAPTPGRAAAEERPQQVPERSDGARRQREPKEGGATRSGPHTAKTGADDPGLESAEIAQFHQGKLVPEQADGIPRNGTLVDAARHDRLVNFDTHPLQERPSEHDEQKAEQEQRDPLHLSLGRKGRQKPFCQTDNESCSDAGQSRVAS